MSKVFTNILCSSLSQKKLKKKNDGLGSQINDLKNENGLLGVQKVRDMLVKTCEILNKTYFCFRANWKPRKPT